MNDSLGLNSKDLLDDCLKRLIDGMPNVKASDLSPTIGSAPSAWKLYEETQKKLHETLTKVLTGYVAAGEQQQKQKAQTYRSIDNEWEV